MQELKKIGVLSTAKIAGLFGLVLGLISIILSKILCTTNIDIAETIGLQCGVLTGGSILLAVVSAGVVYFFIGLIGAALYNLFARWIGGVAVELGKEGKAKK